MFTLRPDQVAVLARNSSAGQLLAEFSKRGFHGLWEENDEEIQFLDPRGYVSRVKLDEHGRIAETISPSGECQEFVYDERHRLAAYRASAGLLLGWTYDNSDRLTSLTRNDIQRWLFETNPEGDLTGIAHPDGTSNRMAYQGLGKLAAYKDRANATTYFQRDGLGRLTAVVTPRGFHTQVFLFKMGAAGFHRLS